jgi:ribosomal protein S18 acetylase RimI-like enzyme
MIRTIRESDKVWVKPLFDSNQSILGPFDVAWYRYTTSKNRSEKWVVIEGEAFAHYLIKKNGERTLYEIAVKSKGKGLGRILLNHIGYPMNLKTDADNAESNEFYRRCGFTCVGQKMSKSGEKTFNIYQRWS